MDRSSHKHHTGNYQHARVREFNSTTTRKLLFHARSVAFFLCIFAGTGQADSLQLTVTSYHFNKDKDKSYNEFNPGAVYAREYPDNWHLLFGGYRNTFSKISLVFGTEKMMRISNSFNTGAQIGFSTGYGESTDSPVAVVGSLFAEKNIVENVGVRLSIMPHKSGILALSLILDLY